MRISKSSFMTFLNSRTPREKKMLALLTVSFFVVVDAWGVIFPVIQSANRVWPELFALKQEIRLIKEDRENKASIEKDWNSARGKMENLEKSFLLEGQTPALLENLSQQAQKAGFKIISLKPMGEPSVESPGATAHIPIVIEALAGTHELGFFLERLESGATFFRINDLKITAAEGENRRHFVKLSIEALGKK